MDKAVYCDQVRQGIVERAVQGPKRCAVARQLAAVVDHSDEFDRHAPNAVRVKNKVAVVKKASKDEKTDLS